MRVVIISTRYSGGGAERSARELLESLNAAGVSASMLVAIRNHADPAYISQMRVRGERSLQVVRKLYRPVDWINIGSKLALHRINRENCDLVHFHNVHGYWMSLKSLHRFCKRMPTVWTLHDEWAATGGLVYDLSHVKGSYEQQIRNAPHSELSFPDTPLAKRYRRYLDRWLPSPSLLISPSLYLQSLVRQSGRFPATECACVPYGLRFKELPPVSMPRLEARQQFGLGGEERVVLLAAAHMSTFYKGIPLAVDALKMLPRSVCKVLVMGRGGEEIAKQIPQQTIVTGFLSDDRKIAAAYRAADITLVPSVADNFPYVALESMACATPLAAFRIGGLSEMIGENERGMLASAFDVSEFASNISRLLDSADLRARLGNAGKAWVEAKCDMAKWTNQHIALYQQTLNTFRNQKLDLPARPRMQVEAE